jgi:putative ABC transport system permease protein
MFQKYFIMAVCIFKKYKVITTINIIGLAGGLALAIALLTVSFHAVRAARANPVDSLRYE